MRTILADGSFSNDKKNGSVIDTKIGQRTTAESWQLQPVKRSKYKGRHLTRREKYPTPSVDYLTEYSKAFYICIHPFDYLLTDAQTISVVEQTKAALRYIINKRSRGKGLHFCGVYSIKIDEVDIDECNPYISILSEGAEETYYLIVSLLEAFNIELNLKLKHDLKSVYWRLSQNRWGNGDGVILDGGTLEVWKQPDDSFYKHSPSIRGARNYQTFGKHYSRPISKYEQIKYKARGRSENQLKYEHYVRNVYAFGWTYNPYICAALKKRAQQ